jgi:hypothetical protein
MKPLSLKSKLFAASSLSSPDRRLGRRNSDYMAKKTSSRSEKFAECAEPLEAILTEAELAIQNGLHYAALNIVLTLPDICSLLELPSREWSKQAKYAGWYDRYMGKRYSHFTGDDCYRVRGGVLHKGRFGHEKSRYDHVSFDVSKGHGVTELLIAGNILNGKMIPSLLSLNLFHFCENMVDCVREWYAENYENPYVIHNIESIVRYRPSGMPPMVHGLPMIG